MAGQGNCLLVLSGAQQVRFPKSGGLNSPAPKYLSFLTLRQRYLESWSSKNFLSWFTSGWVGPNCYHVATMATSSAIWSQSHLLKLGPPQTFLHTHKHHVTCASFLDEPAFLTDMIITHFMALVDWRMLHHRETDHSVLIKSSDISWSEASQVSVVVCVYF